eukprot:1485581-Prorocentrum_lima.AAC.1
MAALALPFPCLGPVGQILLGLVPFSLRWALVRPIAERAGAAAAPNFALPILLRPAVEAQRGEE